MGVDKIMPLSMLQSGAEAVVQKIASQGETKRFLNSLGFIEGCKVMVVSELGGNLIVNVKEARIALSKAMANRIYVA